MRLLCVLLLFSPIFPVRLCDTGMEMTYSLVCDRPFGFTFIMKEWDIIYNNHVDTWQLYSSQPLAQGSVLRVIKGCSILEENWEEFGLDWKHNCTSDGSWKWEEFVHLGDCPFMKTCKSHLEKKLL